MLLSWQKQQTKAKNSCERGRRWMIIHSWGPHLRIKIFLHFEAHSKVSLTGLQLCREWENFFHWNPQYRVRTIERILCLLIHCLAGWVQDSRFFSMNEIPNTCFVLVIKSLLCVISENMESREAKGRWKNRVCRLSGVDKNFWCNF